MCKIMERMITVRLTYYLEKRLLLSQYQSGFRKGGGTMDPGIRREESTGKQRVGISCVF